MSHQKPLESLLPIESFELESGLSLVPRIKLSLTIHRGDKSVSPLDDWQLKRSIIDYLKTSHSITTLPEHDIRIFKFKDIRKRKREDPVARASLFINDLGFLEKTIRGLGDGGVEKRFLEWRKELVEKMDGMEVSLEGVKFRLTAEVPASDDFEGMKKEWEELAALGYPRGNREQPDTIVLRGVPSRWFSEPRVSSKPSMLVTHTIFSAFGKIRNLDVAEDNDIGEDDMKDGGGLVSGLQCRIIVRFENYTEFYHALKVLCGRSLQKQGSRLRAGYDVTWDKDGFFRHARSQADGVSRWMQSTVGNYRNEASRRTSRVSQHSLDDTRRKRFKE